GVGRAGRGAAGWRDAPPRPGADPAGARALRVLLAPLQRTARAGVDGVGGGGTRGPARARRLMGGVPRRAAGARSRRRDSRGRAAGARGAACVGALVRRPRAGGIRGGTGSGGGAVASEGGPGAAAPAAGPAAI